ncbi:MAG: BadF/BadG/BcrA/BcrD ATPase family protein [Cyanobacteriota bacterium]
MTALIAGFDAGQTHTTCRLAQASALGGLQPVGEGRGPGVSHLAAPGGEQRFATALQRSLAAAVTGMGSAAGELAAAGVGASGIEAGSPVQGQGQRLAAATLALPGHRVVVTGDERTALRGAFPSGAGILVISGTGCIAVGRDGEGREHRCGGWGWLLDGRGSAMDIGRDALMASVRMADGRDEDTSLRSALWSALDLATAQELKARVVQADFGPAGFARLAPWVDRLAESGDPQALAIIERSAVGLGELVAGVARALALPSPPVAAVGGALTHLDTLRRAWSADLAARLPGATVVAPQQDACHGALLLARELMGPQRLT